MPKVSHAMLISVGLIGPKVRPNGVTDGLQVKIPVLSCFDRKLQGWTEWEKSNQVYPGLNSEVVGAVKCTPSPNFYLGGLME